MRAALLTLACLLLAPFVASGLLTAAELPNFADLVENNSPSIVEISTMQRVQGRAAIPDEELEELLQALLVAERNVMIPIRIERCHKCVSAITLTGYSPAFTTI